jgi:F0F1-type ATP synthase delta subunit
MLNMELKLPLSVVTQADIARIIREINNLNDFFVSANLRQSGSPMQPARLTRVLDQISKDNQINLLEEDQRIKLAENLQKILEKAPLLHISFAAEPSSFAVEKILGWLRQNIHQYALMQVGLQPTISAGIVLRTGNKVFDLSLRENLKKQESYLAKLIEGAVRGR